MTLYLNRLPDETPGELHGHSLRILLQLVENGVVAELKHKMQLPLSPGEKRTKCYPTLQRQKKAKPILCPPDIAKKTDVQNIFLAPR